MTTFQKLLIASLVLLSFSYLSSISFSGSSDSPKGLAVGQFMAVAPTDSKGIAVINTRTGEVKYCSVVVCPKF